MEAFLAQILKIDRHYRVRLKRYFRRICEWLASQLVKDYRVSQFEGNTSISRIRGTCLHHGKCHFLQWPCKRKKGENVKRPYRDRLKSTRICRARLGCFRVRFRRMYQPWVHGWCPSGNITTSTLNPITTFLHFSPPGHVTAIGSSINLILFLLFWKIFSVPIYTIAFLKTMALWYLSTSSS